MRPLSDFTKESDQKKMDWVGSREREHVRIHHLLKLLTEARKAHFTDIQLKAGMGKKQYFHVYTLN